MNSCRPATRILQLMVIVTQCACVNQAYTTLLQSMPSALANYGMLSSKVGTVV